MARENGQSLVVVTGASGFIAQHCVRQLLREGYVVRGTLRDLSKQVALCDAIAENDEQASRLSFVRAELTQDQGWEQALTDASFLLHTASPVPLAPPKNEDELVIPARDGTIRVLKAASRAGVRRVVLTSSIAAVLSGHPRTQGRTFTEEDWSALEANIGAYAKSKTLAEQAAWQYLSAVPDNEKFELSVINPAFVIGPMLLPYRNTSNEIVRKLVDREMPGVPRVFFPLVDVRDVALAHTMAMTVQAAAGERFVINGHDMWYLDVAHVLKKAGYKVPTLRAPNWLVHAVSWYDPTVRHVLDDLGWAFHPSSAKAKRMLDFVPRDVTDTIVDTAKSIETHRSSAEYKSELRQAPLE